MPEFPWCGLNIDTHALEIKVDYSRYKDTRMDGIALFLEPRLTIYGDQV
jgi:hypothetical protein